MENSATRRRGPRSVKPETPPNNALEEEEEGFEPWVEEDASVPVLEERGLCGLRNYGNTCFLNANIQSLAACPPFCEYLSRLTSPLPVERRGATPRSSSLSSSNDTQSSRLDRPFDQRSPLASALGQTFREIWTPRNGRDLSTGPSSVLLEMGNINPLFRGREQQDAHEALRCLLDAMHEQLKVEVPKEFEPGWQPPSPEPKTHGNLQGSNEEKSEEKEKEQKKEPTGKRRRERYEQSGVSDLFQGYLRNQVSCLECGHRSDTREQFYDISLSLTREVQRQLRASRRRPAPNLSKVSSMSSQSETSGLVGRNRSSGQIDIQYPNGPSSTSSQHDTRKAHTPNSPQNKSLPRRNPCSSTTNLLGRLSAPFTEWLGWGPSVPLEELLRHFCSPERMVGPNQYHCSKCKKKVDAEKTVSFSILPEVLVIHLKRFRHNGNVFGNSKVSTKVQFPLEDLDLSQFQEPGSGCRRRCVPASEADLCEDAAAQSQYQLLAIIQHHGMSVNGGHYTASCRNRVSGRWYEFSDQLISLEDEQTVLQKEPYLLFYQKVQNPAILQEDEAALQSKGHQQSASSSSPPGPFSHSGTDSHSLGLPLWWYLKWKYCSHPGPICPHDLVCPHGRLKPFKGRFDPQHFISLSSEAMDYLQDKYGPFPEWEATSSLRQEAGKGHSEEQEGQGLPPLLIFRDYDKAMRRSLSRRLVETEPCKTCDQAHRALADLQLQEREEVQRLDAAEEKDTLTEWYLVDAIWLQDWKKYITSDPREDLDSPFPSPGPIANHRLIDSKTKAPLPNKKKATHYRGLNSQVWSYLQKTYGGGPEIRRTTVDLYEEGDSAQEEEEEDGEEEEKDNI